MNRYVIESIIRENDGDYLLIVPTITIESFYKNYPGFWVFYKGKQKFYAGNFVNLHLIFRKNRDLPFAYDS